MYSQEKRRERYQMIIIWKLSQGLVSGYSFPFQNNARRGTHVLVPPFATNSPSSVKKAREASLQVKDQVVKPDACPPEEHDRCLSRDVQGCP
jgi:hypothetical protein